MAIIRFSEKYKSPEFTLLNLYPNQMVADKEKDTDDWKKTNMDYFFNVAINQFARNKHIKRNYELVKGILRRDDFYEEQKVKSFMETLEKDLDLPSYVKHYSILTPAINTLLGELSKRPDNTLVRAFDDDSKAEELRYKTELLNTYVIQSVKQRLQATYAAQGVELQEDELAQMSQEELEDELTNYTSMAEKWGSRVLDGLKARLGLKEKSEDAFRDLLISGREAFHIYEDNTSLGFNIEVINPINLWYLTTPNKKYISDSLDNNGNAYAAGTIDVMELSEILNKFTLTEEEVKYLRDMSQQAYLINSRESNLVNPKTTGINSIQYDTYDPLVLEARLQAESVLQENPNNELDDFLGVTNNVGIFGNKYTVVQAYWCSKKKVGSLTFTNQDGEEQTLLVDENYKEGSHSQQITIEWGWVNQWYQGVKIGLDIYYVKPLEILDYCPIIGSLFEIKNVQVKSLVDLMKPFQMLYNVAVNQLFRLLEKDLGVVLLYNIRHVPVPKDGDYQDAIELWETDAREKGIMFLDDSPENMKAPSSFNQVSRQDLSRANEIQTRYNLAIEMRNECWKLVGLSEQRVGGVTSSETATATNAALTQSYAQTEPWFSHHECTLNKVYQALLDVAQYIESQKDVSNLSFLSTEGEKSFIEINGPELKLKDLWVFVTSRSEDARSLQELRQLAQAMLQNGATPYEIAQLYTTKSLRQMKDVFKKLKEKQEQFQQQEMQQKQAEMQQQESQFQKQQQLVELQQQKQLAYDAYQKQLDRISAERIAAIAASAKNNSNPPDLAVFDNQESKIFNDYQFKIQELGLKQQTLLSNHNLQMEKMKVERERTKSQERIAHVNKNKTKN